MSNPIRRPSRGATQLDHENRIQTLERRIPERYPRWYGQLFSEVTNANNEGDQFHFFSADECFDPDPTQCEDTFVTSGDYILFPLGENGPFHVYMNVFAVGGFANFDNPYVPVDAGVTSPSKRFRFWPEQEIWRDNAPYGTISTWVYQSEGEILSADSEDAASNGRGWWLHYIGYSGISDPGRDRHALRFTWTWNKAADVSFSGNVNVFLEPPDPDTVGNQMGSFFT